MKGHWVAPPKNDKIFILFFIKSSVTLPSVHAETRVLSVEILFSFPAGEKWESIYSSESIFLTESGQWGRRERQKRVAVVEVWVYEEKIKKNINKHLPGLISAEWVKCICARWEWVLSFVLTSRWADHSTSITVSLKVFLCLIYWMNGKKKHPRELRVVSRSWHKERTYFPVSILKVEGVQSSDWG